MKKKKSVKRAWKRYLVNVCEFIATLFAVIALSATIVDLVSYSFATTFVCFASLTWLAIVVIDMWAKRC